MKKKLLIVGSNSVHIYNFIDLIKEKFDEILLLSNEINKHSDVNVITADFSLGIQSIKTINKIKKIVSEFQPSIIHMHQANSYAFLTTLAVKKYSVPLVLTAWGSDILLNPKKSFLLKKMVQYILRHAEVVTADSDYVLESAQNLVDQKLSLHNINFGIVIEDCPEFNKENIIYSNRSHTDLYNIDKIIISFSKYIKENKDWKLVIASKGKDTEKLKVLVSKLQLDNSVEFVGFLNQEENYRYYCKSKVYVSIPGSDSISISLVEAIICGCVPFVSNLRANLELIKNGENGWVENNLDQIDFSKYEDINFQSFETTREKMKIQFSKESNKKKYFSIYEALGI